MIVFDLECRSGGHRFEGWFGSSGDFTAQQARGLVNCPHCDSADVLKAPMAANLARKGNQLLRQITGQAVVPAASAGATAVPVTATPAVVQPPAIPPAAAAMMQAYVRMQAKALKASSWVGDKFAADVRAMHYGDKDHAAIHGQVTPQDAHDLLEEGIDVAPILFPVAPPGHVN